MELIYNNYIRASGHGDAFRVDFELPTTSNYNYFEICKDLATQLYDERQGQLYLMYSGGVDSEFVLNVFLSLNIPITPVIIKLGYNDHDVKYAFDFCTSKNLTPLVIDFDFDTFVKSGKIVDIATQYKIAAYQLPSTFSVLTQLDGTIVMGSHGPAHIKKYNDVWYLDEYEPIWTVLDYFKQNKLHGCPFFLIHRAEQYATFLNDPLMKELADNKIPGKLGSNSSKWIIYNKLAPFDLVERTKYTGYEHVEQQPIFQHENMQWFKTVEKQWWGNHRIPFTDVLSRLDENKNNI